MEELKKARKAINKYFATYEAMAAVSSEGRQRTFAFYSVVKVVRNRVELAREFNLPLCVFMNEFRIVAERRMYDEERICGLNLPGFFSELELMINAISYDWETFIKEPKYE